MKPVLYIVIPCYNEEKVLPITSGMFLEKLKSLISEAVISDDSRIMFVNDGSRDSTWDIITGLSEEEKYFTGISLSRNRGHQNALLAGLLEAEPLCDITISIDCDGQDDINAIDSMVREYLDGAEIVYGVRSSRETDTFFKRTTAQGFYKLMNRMGANVVYNHADYRLFYFCPKDKPARSSVFRGENQKFSPAPIDPQRLLKSPPSGRASPVSIACAEVILDL